MGRWWGRGGGGGGGCVSLWWLSMLVIAGRVLPFIMLLPSDSCCVNLVCASTTVGIKHHCQCTLVSGFLYLWLSVPMVVCSHGSLFPVCAHLPVCLLVCLSVCEHVLKLWWHACRCWGRLSRQRWRPTGVSYPPWGSRPWCAWQGGCG